jgi:hypothetical protein
MTPRLAFHSFFIALVALIASCGKSEAQQPNSVARAGNEAKTAGGEDKEKVDTFTIAMNGDTMFGTDYPTVRLAADDGRQLFKHTEKLTQEADLALGNLEGVFGTTNLTTNKSGPNNYTFRFPARYAPRLKEAGYDFMCMANNHSNDFKDEGVNQTRQALKEQGIAYAGIVSDPEYVVLERNGVKFGICAFGHNRNTILHTDMRNVERVLTALRPKCDILIVTFHGGAEGRSYKHLPEGEEFMFNASRGSLRKLAHYCVDNGADIVFGHGPHVVRCMELYKDRLIAYSLGNFCTPYGMNIADITGYAPVLVERIDSKGRFIDAKIHSFRQQPGIGPQPDSQCLVAKEIRELTESDIKDNQLDIADDGTVTRKK